MKKEVGRRVQCEEKVGLEPNMKKEVGLRGHSEEKGGS